MSILNLKTAPANRAKNLSDVHNLKSRPGVKTPKITKTRWNGGVKLKAPK